MVASACTIGRAEELLDAFLENVSDPGRQAVAGQVGFGIREGRMVFLVDAPDESAARDVFPSRFDGFSVLHERSRLDPLGYYADRARRSLGRKPLQAWPGWPGSLIEAESGKYSGTLGFFVTQAGASYAVTCAHVFRASDRASLNGSPVDSWVGSSCRRIGRVSDPEHNRELRAALDVGLVTLADARWAVNVIPRIGRLSTEVLNTDLIPLQSLVCKYGAKTNLTFGRITALRRDFGSNSNHAPRTKPLIEITPEGEPGQSAVSLSFCSPGDSGSVVVLHRKESIEVQVLGILCKRSTTGIIDRGYMRSFSEVAEKLTLKIPS
ncbi:MAG TPA: hypothetical protein VF777_04685 [Phycisphaerales bacterium]